MSGSGAYFSRITPTAVAGIGKCTFQRFSTTTRADFCAAFAIGFAMIAARCRAKVPLA